MSENIANSPVTSVNIHTAPAVFLNHLWHTGNLPEIQIPHQGMTSYIDYLKVEDLKGNKVVKGQDPFGRKVIAFHILYTNPNGKTREIVLTAFQRYSDNPNFWVTAGDRSDLLEPEDEHRTSHETIQKLMKGETCTRTQNKSIPEIARTYTFRLA